MSEKEKNNIPPYYFIGFRVLKVIYNRNEDGQLKELLVKINDSKMGNDQLHRLTAEITMKFDGNEESYLAFDAGFEINDNAWYENIDKNQLDILFFSALFPYMREKIYNLTHDVRGSVDLPTIDLRTIDLTKGLSVQVKKDK